MGQGLLPARQAGLLCWQHSSTFLALPKLLLQVVALAARDSEAKVREASLVAVGEMAEHCLPEFAEQSLSILPFLYGALQDPVARVQSRACAALEAYCDHLGGCFSNYTWSFIGHSVGNLQTLD